MAGWVSASSSTAILIPRLGCACGFEDPRSQGLWATVRQNDNRNAARGRSICAIRPQAGLGFRQRQRRDPCQNELFDDRLFCYGIEMEIRTLRAFVEVVRQGGFSQAAKTVFATQSTVSKAVKQLEDECGVLLLDRIGHRSKLTAAGEIVYRRAQRILAA